jgi:TolA-binding protein
MPRQKHLLKSAETLKITSGCGRLTDNPSSQTVHTEALELVATFLREHEKNLDMAVDGLANVIERLRPAENAIRKITDIEEKIDEMQRQLSDLNLRLRYQREDRRLQNQLHNY